MKTGSPSMSLAKEDYVKIAKGAALAAVGAILTYGIEVVIPDLASQPGANAALFVLITTGLNAVRKFLFDTQKVK